MKMICADVRWQDDVSQSVSHGPWKMKMNAQSDEEKEKEARGKEPNPILSN